MEWDWAPQIKEKYPHLKNLLYGSVTIALTNILPPTSKATKPKEKSGAIWIVKCETNVGGWVGNQLTVALAWSSYKTLTEHSRQTFFLLKHRQS